MPNPRLRKLLFDNPPVFDVTKFGAVGDGVTDDTAAIQAALDAICAYSGGTVLIPASANPYILKVAGVDAYTHIAGVHKYCLDIRCNNTILRIQTGAVLKLADGEQTDAGGAVNIIIFQNRTNITINGGGRITGNTVGQAGWSGGYAQNVNGVIINGCHNNTNIIIRDITLDDHFSNPVNFENPHAGTVNTNIRLENLTGLNCGEGFQICLATGAYMIDCTYTDNAGVSVGDSFEFSGCTNWLCDGCTHTFGAGFGASAGSGFDLTGSQYGTLSNFVSDGGSNGVDIQGISYQAIHDVTVTNGIIRNLINNGTGVYIRNEAHTETPINCVVSNLTITPAVGAACIGFQIAPNLKMTGPVAITNCDITGMAGAGRAAYSVKACTHLTITGGTVTNCNYGVDWYGYSNAASDADLIDQNFVGITFINSTTRDMYFHNTGATKNPSGAITNITFTNNVARRLYFEQSTMLNMVVSDSTPDTYAGYGGLSNALQMWGYAVIAPINNRTWAQMLYGTYEQSLEFDITGTELFVDKTQPGGVNISLAGNVNFQTAPGNKLTLQFDQPSLTWIETSREV